MAKRKKLQPADLLGPLEAKVMAAVWRYPDLTAVDAAAMINARNEKQLSSYTILHTFRALERKGYVRHRVDGRTFYYSAAVPEDEFVGWVGQRELDRLLDRFGDDLRVPRLVRTDPEGPAVLARLRELVAHYDEEAEEHDGGTS